MDRLQLLEANLAMLQRVQMQGVEVDVFVAVRNDLHNQRNELIRQAQKTTDPVDPVDE